MLQAQLGFGSFRGLVSSQRGARVVQGSNSTNTVLTMKRGHDWPTGRGAVTRGTVHPHIERDQKVRTPPEAVVGWRAGVRG